MGFRFSAAAVLKAIRDRKATTPPELGKRFSHDPHSANKLRKMIRDLQQAGLIDFSNGRFKVTDKWTRIKDALGISLTSLDQNTRPGAISVTPLFGRPSSIGVPADVFVLMSFDPSFTPIYVTYISRVVKDLGLRAGRADDFFSVRSVMNDVWAAVHGSRVVIADCTTRNPNVFYEIGMAHTVGKPVILITQHESDVPFDLRHLRYIKYTYSPPGMKAFEAKLKRTLQDVLK